MDKTMETWFFMRPGFSTFRLEPDKHRQYLFGQRDRRQRAEVEVPVRSFHPADRFAHAELLEILGSETGKPFRELPAIEVADPEADPDRGVREHRRQELRVPAPQLLQVLVREDQAEPVLPRPREDRSKSWRREMVELIYI